MRQQQYKRGAIYQITGPTGLKRKVKYIGKFTFEKDVIHMYRDIRVGFKKVITPTQ